MGLRLKLLLGLVISIALVILPFWFIAEKYITRSIEADYQNRASTALHIFQASIGGSKKIDREAVKELAGLLQKTDPKIEHIHYYTLKKGKTIFTVSSDHRHKAFAAGGGARA